MRTQKGFTLFTALISLLLVSISLALIFNMINTEETYLSLIQDQSSLSDLMTVGDIARADAFNTFIITLRTQWESYKSKDDAAFKLDRKYMDQNWDEFVNTFTKDAFFEQSFAAYFAQGLLFNLQYSQNPPGYNITIDDEGIRNTVDSTGDNTFDEVVAQMFIDGGEKVDVIECSTDNENCIGSFYLTLDTTKLPDEKYEILPVVTVLKYKSNQVIQRPVLSRQIYKIYMPWRGFQAFRVARNIAHGNDVEKSGNPAIGADTGLFSPDIHNTLEQARLGFCDPGTCAPRTNFFVTPTLTGDPNNRCHEISNPSISTSSLPTTLGFTSLTLQPFILFSDSTTANTQFKDLYQATLFSNLQSRPSDTIIYNNGLVMQGTAVPLTNDVNIFSVNVVVNKKRTKTYSDAAPGVGSTNYTPQSSFSVIDNMIEPVGGLGLFLDPDNSKSKYIWEVDSDWYNANRNLAVDSGNAGQSYELSCSEIEYTEIKLKFVETDPRYRVKASYGSLPVTINVVLIDQYTPFYFPPSNSWSDLEVRSDDYLEPITTLATADPALGNSWKCNSFINATAASCTPPPN